MILFTIHLFNRLRILCNGIDCTDQVAKSARQQALFAFLITSPKFTRSIEEICETLYDKDHYQRPHLALKMAVGRLSQQMRSVSVDVPEDVIVLDGPNCRLNPNCFASDDVRQLSDLAQQARQLQLRDEVDEADILRLFEQAQSLYTGRLLHALDAYFQPLSTEFCHGQYLLIVRSVLYALQSRALIDQAILTLKIVYARFPDDEDVQQLLLGVLFSAGSQRDIKLYYKLMLSRQRIDGDCTKAFRAFYHQYAHARATHGLSSPREEQRTPPIICTSDTLESYGTMMQGIATRNGLSMFAGILRFSYSALADQVLQELRGMLRSSDVIAKLSETDYSILMLVRRYPHGYAVMERLARTLEALMHVNGISWAETTLRDCMLRVGNG